MITVIKNLLLLFILSLMAIGAYAQNDIRLNQIGFYPAGEKVAVIVSDEQVPFSLMDDETGEVAFTSELSIPKTRPYSDETVVWPNSQNLSRQAATECLRMDSMILNLFKLEEMCRENWPWLH